MRKKPQAGMFLTNTLSQTVQCHEDTGLSCCGTEARLCPSPCGKTLHVSGDLQPHGSSKNKSPTHTMWFLLFPSPPQTVERDADHCTGGPDPCIH